METYPQHRWVTNGAGHSLWNWTHMVRVIWKPNSMPEYWGRRPDGTWGMRNTFAEPTTEQKAYLDKIYAAEKN